MQSGGAGNVSVAGTGSQAMSGLMKYSSWWLKETEGVSHLTV
jgi:hypothetical protein